MYVQSDFDEFCFTGTLKTVQMSFSPEVEKLNRNTALWRKQFADELQTTISEVMLPHTFCDKITNKLLDLVMLFFIMRELKSYVQNLYFQTLIYK